MTKDSMPWSDIANYAAYTKTTVRVSNTGVVSINKIINT